MKKKDVDILQNGLYKLFWKEGGSSLASVGQLINGDMWYAPTNWVDKTEEGIACTNWRTVEKALRLDKNGAYLDSDKKRNLYDPEEEDS